MRGLAELARKTRALPLEAIDRAHWPAREKQLSARERRWARACGFDASPGTFCLLPDAHGDAARVLAGVDASTPMLALGALPSLLPAGDYRLDNDLVSAPDAALGWALGAYRFSRYVAEPAAPPRLNLPRAVLEQIAPTVDAICKVRDLVNTPSEDMDPPQLCDAVRELARAHRARYREWSGDELLRAGFPTVHAVGRGSAHAPRVAELRWGKASDPLLAIVGKGVCFDSGGLSIKSADGMRWMKKDMGGAAHAIALAQLIMTAKLPVRLLVIIPAVDNAISGNAMRPGEVIRTRAGVTVEVDNTDAEGRLILCDALAACVEEKPDLLIDFATLTGAARVALGPDLPALFANDDRAAEQVLAAARAQHDPLWRLPLWRPYRTMLASHVADLANTGSSRHAGAITAALYLERFVPSTVPWLHVDVYAWNDNDRPGKPRGGEAQSLRAFFA
ncbi:MAG TPA: leucyl aminopeptidase family protein, partial [Rhodanobacteraceae bacterium]|nr:leucyl aminopeptidase family protein [Rhodanobacteraceae bacterium]